MSQQALDLQRSIQIVRHYKVLVGIVIVLGILAGGAYTVLRPPMLTSTALIALPESPLSAQSSGTTSVDPYTATQEVVAGSYQVLLDAVPDSRPAMTVNQLRRDVQIGTLAPDIISITATGATAADAEATANAVTNSYVHYVTSSNSAVGHVQAQVLQPAKNATGPARTERTIIFALLGALVGGLIGVIVALAIGRNDRRLRQRDEIANSIGVPVLASFPVAHPGDAAGWTKLLEDYKPAAVHALRLQQALQQLGAASVNGPSGSNDRSSFTVLSLSSDPGAVALGPQLAVFAASQGIPTTLVVGPQQDANATATLRTACAVSPAASSRRPSDLRLTVSDSQSDIHPDTTLTVVVAVVDTKSPRVPATVATSATVLGVSAGASSAEQLARAAVSAALDGREVVGILVADPESDDRTTGRIPQLPRPTRRRVPLRLRGMTTEIRR